MRIESILKDFYCGFNTVCLDAGFKKDYHISCDLEIMKGCVQLKRFKTHLKAYLEAVRERELISKFTEKDYKELEVLALEMYK